MANRAKLLPNTYCSCRRDTLIQWCPTCRRKYEREQLKRDRRETKRELKNQSGNGPGKEEI